MPEETKNTPVPADDASARQKRIEDFLLDPDKAIFRTLEEFRPAVEQIVAILSQVDLDALEQLQGTDGYTPVRGKDYFTEEDIAGLERFIVSKIPKVGVELASREQVEAFIRAEVAKIPRVKGEQGEQGRAGKDGENGSPDTGADIVKKIRSLRGDKNKMLRIDDVRGLERVLKTKVSDDQFAELEKRVDNFKIVFPASPGGGDSGSDATAIHSDGVSEFDSITEDDTPAAGDYFIAERASDGTKIKVPFSAIGDGADGRTILNGTGAPNDANGVDGDFYIDTSAWDIYLKVGSSWGSATSIIGPQGDAGTNGTNGTDGDDGKTVLNGTVDPTTEGVDGDFYINTNSWQIFGPKASGTWPAGVDMLGEDGAGTGDMEAATYDPTNVAGDAFDMDNMNEGTDTKIMTAAERTKLGHVSVTQAVDLDTMESDLSGVKTKTDNITVTQAVDLDAIETRVNALDAAVILKGTWDASGGTFPGSGSAQAGESWIVSVGGTVDSVEFAAGDRLIAIVDNASTGTFAANWFKADYTDLFNTTTLGDLINSATAKTTPVDADMFALMDSAASNIAKKLSWANLKTGVINALLALGGTFTADVSVPDEAYDATGWNGSMEVPTKNAIRDKIESLSGGGTKELFIPLSFRDTTAVTFPFSATLGGFPYGNVINDETFAFLWKCPSDFSSLTEVKLVVIPDATETVTYSIADLNFAAAGQAYNTHSTNASNNMQAVAANQITELELKISTLWNPLAADDYIGLYLQSNVTQLRVLGVRFKYA